MEIARFPPLPLQDWRATRDTLQGYARIMGLIRRSLSPRQKHWGHASLSVSATGLTTTPIPGGPVVFELRQEFAIHRAIIATHRGGRWEGRLHGQPVPELLEEMLGVLHGFGISIEVDRELLPQLSLLAYDRAAVERFWDALVRIDACMKRFKGELDGETGPVQFWPHHFDLAMHWFSGRKVPGVDPTDEENADEQMNFGFSSGDEGIPAPYFYATAYPFPDGIAGAALPAGAWWQREGWHGAVMLYDKVQTAADGESVLLEFLHAAHRAGASRMHLA